MALISSRTYDRSLAPSNYVNHISGEDIISYKVVKSSSNKIFHASSDDTDSYNKVIGISKLSSLTGENNIVFISGEIHSNTFSFIEGRNVFLGLDGELSQTKPSEGFVQSMGVASAPDKIIIKIGNPIKLT